MVRKKDEIASLFAWHRIDDETGLPYWEVYGEGDKDSERMEPGEVLTYDPKRFPPGTRVVIFEPGMDDPRSKGFYEQMIGQRGDYYPLEDERLEEVLRLNEP